MSIPPIFIATWESEIDLIVLLDLFNCSIRLSSLKILPLRIYLSIYLFLLEILFGIRILFKRSDELSFNHFLVWTRRREPGPFYLKLILIQFDGRFLLRVLNFIFFYCGHLLSVPWRSFLLFELLINILLRLTFLSEPSWFPISLFLEFVGVWQNWIWFQVFQSLIHGRLLWFLYYFLLLKWFTDILVLIDLCWILTIYLVNLVT